jgi:hypothetical protein
MVMAAKAPKKMRIERVMVEGLRWRQKVGERRPWCVVRIA